MSVAYNPDPFAVVAKPSETKDFTVKTGKYTFIAHVGPDFIGVGGKDKSCVQISPSGKKLMWVESSRKGECEVNGLSIAGDATVELAQLAITIMQKHQPHIEELILEDSSSFKCALPNGTTQHMNLNIRDALIYGKTFYERKFNASELETDFMKRFRINRRDPSKKPAQFDFNSIELKPILQPLYDEAETWAEFMHSLYVKYGSVKMCAYIYPWYHSAFYLLSGHSEPPFKWRITILEQPDLPYIVVKDIKEGGSYWNTVRQVIQRPTYYGGGIIQMPYSKYAKSQRLPRKTRKLKR